MPEDLAKNQIYLPAGQASNVVKDANGRCWELSGYQEQTELTPIEDLDTYTIIDQEICCEECNENDLFEDILIPYPTSEESDSLSPSTTTESSSSSSEEDYSSSSESESEDILCSSGCCETKAIGWGFSREECKSVLDELEISFEEICKDDCGPPFDLDWELCDVSVWYKFEEDIPGIWTCGYCCEEENSSSNSA